MILRKIKYLIIAGFTLLSFTAYAQNSPDTFFRLANRFFNQNVKNGRVKYASIKSNPEKLNELINLIPATDLSNARSDVWKSFLINTYNILVIKNVVNHYPINSVNDIPGFFSEKIIKIGNDSLSLSDIEKNSLKSVFKDPKINFLLCKAQLGGPGLQNFAYRPDILTTQILEQTTAILNDTAFIREDNNGGIMLSFLFFENKPEFTLTTNSLHVFINKYRKKPLGEDSLFTYFQPDDGLNDKPDRNEEQLSIHNLTDTLIKNTISDQDSLLYALESNDNYTVIDLTGFQPKNLSKKDKQAGNFFINANRFFEKYVYEGKVDYGEIKRHPGTLNHLLGLIPAVDLGNEKSDTKSAFWINAYNLLVIKTVIDHYPFKKISDINGFYEKDRYKINGEDFSLNTIEKIKIKNQFKDPRINLVLCKGTVGSPYLLNEAYGPEILSTQIMNQTTAIINDTNYIKTGVDGTYMVLDIFEKNRNDFLLFHRNLQHFFNKYRQNPVGNDSSYTFFSGNDLLNDDLTSNPLMKQIVYNENDIDYSMIKPDLTNEADDGNISGFIKTPKRQFEIRFNNNFTTYKEFYGKKLYRNTSRYSYASNNSQLQLFYGIGRKTNVGISIAGRTSRLAGTFENPTQVYHFGIDSNAIFYIRTISPIARFDISDGFINVKMQATFNFPIQHVKNLRYNGIRLIDENPYQLNTQFYFYRNVSEYVRLNFEADIFFKFDNQIKSFTYSPRTIASTIFQMPIGKKINLFGIIESAPTGNNVSYFSNYYFKEGAGLKVNINKSVLTLYYSYVFFGKNVNAFQSVVLNIKSIL